MKKLLLLLVAVVCGINVLTAHPVDVEKAKAVGRNFVSANFEMKSQTTDLQLVYSGVSNRDEACFYVFNVGNEGFVIVSADDRFRPIVGYSDEGPFATENMSPELSFYLDRIIDARTSPNAVLFADTQEEWRSVSQTGKLLSRNGGRAVDYICTTKWNQDSPYNLYAPEASSGPGGRCYAGCVATAMSQVMKHWNHPAQGSGSHSYYCYGYGTQSANFGNTTYHWELMPDRLGGASQEEIEAVALFMYHCGVSVDMGFSPSGSGANSWDVPNAINRYFSYSSHASLKTRDDYSLLTWQNMLKESIDLGWPLYYSGFSESGGHAFVCDGYDDNDLFHFNWGWGGSSDGWFVVDEIDYAGWAQAVFNYVPANVYDYMAMQPDNFEVNSLGDYQYSATLSWLNPTQDIHGNPLQSIDQMVVTRDGQVVYTNDNVTPGQSMTFTDHYMPTAVRYAVYAVTHDAKGLEAYEDDVLLGPTCNWTIEMISDETGGWDGGHISLMNMAGVEINQITSTSASATRNVLMPLGHVGLYWNHPTEIVEKIGFELRDPNGQTVVSFNGKSSDLKDGLFFIVNNTCGDELNRNVPSELSATIDGNNVNLQWTAAEGDVHHYAIYRDHLMYALTETTNYTDVNGADMFHHYYITTITDLGESDPSNVCNTQPESDCIAPYNLRYEWVNHKAKLSWDAPQGEAPAGYFVYRRTRGEEFKRIKSLTSTTYNDNINSRDEEFYEYAVAAYYAATDCTSAMATAANNPEMNYITVNTTEIPSGLRFIFVNGQPVLAWNEALHAQYYNVYRNGELIAENLTYPLFTDETAVAQQPYRYTVTGKTLFVESNPSNEVYVDWTTGVEELSDIQGIEIYPNPTSNQLTIEGKAINQVVVFNLMGQEMLRQNVNANKAVVSMGLLPEGTYFVRIETEQEVTVRKVVKL